MDLAYDTLDDVSDQVSKINSLVVQAADATTSPESAKAIGAEIKEHVASIVDLMNTKYMGKYIFSGANVQKQAYSMDEDTSAVTYNGSTKETGDRVLTIAEGTAFTYNVTGDKVFNEITLYSTTTDEEGNEVTQTTQTDFFTEMQDLYNLLNQDTLDYEAIRKKLDVTNETVKNLTNQIGDISAKVSKLNTAASVNETAIINLQERKSEIEEVDITKAATELSNARNTLQASYTLTSSILSGGSLLDYL
jgi:flagellin-like hook-associated protein FlgL